ncbi:hypothetical protein ACWGDT_32470 [Streptomyces avermitilis]
MTHPPAGPVLAALVSRATGGRYWRLDRPGAGLDAEALHVPPGAAAEPPGDRSREVLVIALDGGGRLRTPDGWLELAPPTAVWLPPTTGYRLHAGEAGLHCVTVRPRRPAAPPALPATAAIGEPACLLHQVCAECGRMATESDARYCNRCGSPLER